jgi:hypothetical protein
MRDWYVGRKANFHQQWYQSYRQLLRTIDSCPDWSVARVIRYSQAVPPNPNDRFIYLGIHATSSSEATRIGTEIFETAEKLYRVGFGTVYPAEPISDIDRKNFLSPTEFALDGRIPVEPLREEEDLAGAFSYYDSAAQPIAHSTTDSTPFDRFLMWLSATGEGRWESFLRVARILGVANDVPNARRLFRRLVLLGHLDSSLDGRDWSIAPPVIVQSAAQPQSAFWCGCRSGPLLRSLPASWQAEDPLTQPDGFGPAKRPIVLPSVVDDQWLPPSTEPPTWQTPSWGGPVAVRLAALLPHIEEWAKTLQSIASLTPPAAVEHWDLASASFLNAPDFRIDPTGRCHGTTGMYRLAYGEVPNVYHLTVFLDSTSPPGCQLLRGEWYGLRFLALHSCGKYLKAVWSEADGGTLAILVRQRWPLLYERALVLASGLLPDNTTNSRYLYYRGVPIALAQSVADLLGVKVETDHE